jgi:ATP-dependent protease ClpP protease subunit
MAHDAYNFIHFGNHPLTIKHENELNYSVANEKKQNKLLHDIYLTNTKLTKKELSKFFNCENSGKLYAEQCLTKGLCDWVITPKGWINNVKDLQQSVR